MNAFHTTPRRGTSSRPLVHRLPMDDSEWSTRGDCLPVCVVGSGGSAGVAGRQWSSLTAALLTRSAGTRTRCDPTTGRHCTPTPHTHSGSQPLTRPLPLATRRAIRHPPASTVVRWPVTARPVRSQTLLLAAVCRTQHCQRLLCPRDCCAEPLTGVDGALVR